MDREPLSVRRGLKEPDHRPFEGMPGHLEHACRSWVRNALHDPSDPWSESVPSLVAARLRVVVDRADANVLSSILKACDERGSDFLLDVIDQALWQTQGGTAKDLELLLYNGASVWTVSEDGRSLVRRVTGTEQQAL